MMKKVYKLKALFSKEYNNLSRLVEIDIFRSLGIISMIMGHIRFGEYFDYFIHAFNMPMFFFVAGMFIKLPDQISLRIYFNKKVKTTLIPYVFFGLFHFCIWSLIRSQEFSWDPLIHLMLVNTYDLPIAGALWFLTAFFIAELLYVLVRKYLQSKVLYSIIIAVIAVAGCLCRAILPFHLPWALDAAFVGVGLIHIGWIFKNTYILNKILSMKLQQYTLLGIVTVILISANGYINMRTGSYSFIPLFWINATLAVVVGINISKLIVSIVPESMSIILSSVGRNSIVYLCLNQLVIMFTTKAIGMLALSLLVSKVLILTSTMIILYICDRIIIGSRLRGIIGK